ncbi:MAG: glycosyltransferase family 2 protein [Prevotella sp.]|nr:glycosyltransferase family 2 protein [Prevotella sp.]
MEQTYSKVSSEEKVTVSVLVAVYNGEKTLPYCLDSMLGQTLRDIEVICVDDCSTDNSVQVLETYAARDSRIKIIRLPENHGQAFARNQALKVARGEYVCMLDCDDWMSLDALESAVRTFEKNERADCVLFSLIFQYESGKQKEFCLACQKPQSGHDAFLRALDWDGIHGVYMIRTVLHRQFPYDESALLYSDDNTSCIHFVNSREVDVCEGRYYYIQHPASMTHAVSPRRFLRMKAMQSLREQIVAMGEPEDVVAVLDNRLWLLVVDTYMFYYEHRRRDLTAEDCRRGLAEIHRVWKEAPTGNLLPENSRKFGYLPLKGSWMLFRCQEELYFFLKKIKEKICK